MPGKIIAVRKIVPVTSVRAACGNEPLCIPLLDAVDQRNSEAVQQQIDADTDMNSSFNPWVVGV